MDFRGGDGERPSSAKAAAEPATASDAAEPPSATITLFYLTFTPPCIVHHLVWCPFVSRTRLYGNRESLFFFFDLLLQKWLCIGSCRWWNRVGSRWKWHVWVRRGSRSARGVTGWACQGPARCEGKVGSALSYGMEAHVSNFFWNRKSGLVLLSFGRPLLCASRYSSIALASKMM